MTKQLFVLLLIIIISHGYCFSQDKEIPIATVTQKDYLKAKELVAAYQYDEALEYILKAKKDITKEESPLQFTEVLILEAKCHTHQYQMEDALRTYKDITQLGIDLKNEKIESRGLNAQSVIYSFYGNFDQVKDCSYRIFHMNRDSVSFNYLSDAHSTLGDVYSYEYQPDSSIYHYTKALYIDTLHKDTNSMSFNYMAIGGFYYSMGENQKAIKKYLEGVETLRPKIDDFKMAEFYRKLTQVFIAEMNFVKAKEYAILSMKVSEDKNLTLNKAYSYNVYGIVLLDEKNYPEAEKYLLKAKEILDVSNKKFGIISNNSDLANLYLETNQPEKAEEVLNFAQQFIDRNDKSKDLAKYDLARTKLYISQTNFIEAKRSLEHVKSNPNLDKVPYLQLNALKMEYQIAKNSGYFEVALQKLEQANNLRLELDQKSQSYLVHDLEAKYDKATKERKIADLAAQTEIDAIKINQRNNLLVVGMISLLVVLGILAFIFKQNKTIKRMMTQLTEKNALITKTLGEKELLLREIHHRVKNNLQVVSSILSLQSREIVDENALEAISESRNRVKSMAIIHQNLYQDNNLMGINTKDYIEKLSRSLFNSYRVDKDRLELVAEVQEINLDVDTTIPLGLILNELLTNALKYAFPDDALGSIRVELKEENNELLLTVSDNGIGIQEKKENSDSFGLKMIQTFAKKLDADWDVKNDHGTTVSMRIRKYKVAS